MPGSDPPARESAPTGFELVTSRIPELPPPAPDPPAPPGFEWVTEEEFAHRLGCRIMGDRQQIFDDFVFMQKMAGRGWANFERG